MSDPNNVRSVVITGASTGIGRACALHMDRLGWRVFAGIRKDEDAASLQAEASAGLVPISLDVTDAVSIRNALKTVGDHVGPQGLSGLVNNAGVPYGGPIEYMDLEQVRQLFDVNFFGLIAVTQAFLPLLRLARGRIVNMSSDSGYIAVPFVSPYSSSKFAVESLSDSLRVELHPWGMDVAVVEPGAIDTPIWNKSANLARKIVADAPQVGRDLYGRAMHGLLPHYRPHGISADAVARAVAHALTSPHPKTRYIVGSDAAAARLISKLPDRLRDWLMLKRLPKWG